MTTQSILDTIDRYISSASYKYAVLIDGAWGSGKTYFVEHTLIPHLKDTVECIYISLYGMKSADDIGAAISNNLLSNVLWKGPLKNTSEQRRRLITNIGSTAASTLSKLVLGDNYIEDAKKAILDFFDIKNVLFIFDDLERCGFDVCDALGHINNIVEHTECRVLILANEQEIGWYQLDTALEGKLSVAANPHINIRTEQSKTGQLVQSLSGTSPKSDEGNRISYSPEELVERVNVLFGTNGRYLRTREKAIGITIHFSPDIESIFSTLVDDFIDGMNAEKDSSPRLDEVLRGVVPQYVRQMEMVEHTNIRTIQFFLEKLQRLAPVLEDILPDENATEAVEDIVDSVFVASIRYRTGDRQDRWADIEETVEWADGASVGDIFSNPVIAKDFRFVDALVQNNEYDNEYAANVCRNYVIEYRQQAQNKNDPLNRIADWYFQSEEETRKLLFDINLKITSGYYSASIFSDILNKLSMIASKWQEPGIMDSAVSAMEEYIKKSSFSIEFATKPFFLSDTEAEQYYNAAVKKVKEAVSSASSTAFQSKYKKILEDAGEDWGKVIYEDFTNDYRQGKRGHCFLAEVSAPDIADQLLYHSNNASILYFHYYLMDFARNHDSSEKTTQNLVDLMYCLGNVVKENQGKGHRTYDKTQEVLYEQVIDDLERVTEIER